MHRGFSVVIDQVRCHIRNYVGPLLETERVQVSPHKHFSMEFHWVYAGQEIITLPVEGSQVRLTAGKILLLPSGVYHGASTGEGTVDRICFNFSAEAAGEGGHMLLDLFREMKKSVVFENRSVNALLERCRDLRRSPGPLSELQQGTLLLSAVLELFSELAAGQRPESAAPRTLQQRWIIEEYIEHYFTQNLGIEGLARQLYLSQRQTRTLVRQFLGEDYKALVIRRRMELADILLRDSDIPLEEIASQVGYSSYSGFQLCFKKHFGITPSACRAQRKKEEA